MSTTQDLTIEQIRTALAELGYIANIWHTDDVKSVRPDLTDEQCMEVLEKVTVQVPP